ncbi:MAG: hypothetical protein ABIO85_05210 [Sphingomicrobium sp.]
MIADKWAQHALPSSSNVLFLTFLGMPVVGGIVGLVVSAAANAAFRAGPPKLRFPFTVVVWFAFCAFVAIWFLREPYDHGRMVQLIAIVAFCGLLVGPYHAELFVGAWFYKRHLKVIQGEADRRRAELEQDFARQQAELQREIEARQNVRLNRQERPDAIRNYLRS